MLIVHLAVAGIFLALGTVLAFGKGAFLIAGYNTASAEEKAQYDEKKLCRAVSKLMFALAACWVVAALSENVFAIPALIPAASFLPFESECL